MAQKKSTLKKVESAIVDAVSTVAEMAQEHVIEPVGKAIGLMPKKDTEEMEIKPNPKRKPTSAKRVASKKSSTRTKRMLTKGVSGTVAKPAAKASTRKGPATQGRKKGR